MAAEKIESSIPSEQQILDTVKLNFPDLTSANLAINKCKAIFGVNYVASNGNPTATDIRMQNCIMDGQYQSIESVQAFSNGEHTFKVHKSKRYEELGKHMDMGTMHLMDVGDLIMGSNGDAYQASLDLTIQVAGGSGATLSTASLAAIIGVIVAAVVTSLASAYLVVRNRRLQAMLIASEKLLVHSASDSSIPMNEIPKSYVPPEAPSEVPVSDEGEETTGLMKMPNPEYIKPSKLTADGKWEAVETENFIWARDGGVSRPMNIISSK